jgi:drug/metabolite transporter (DMT)-like permease
MSKTFSIFTGLAAGVISALSFGASPLFARHLYAAGFSVEAVLFFRFLPAALILGMLLLFRGEWHFTRRELIYSLLPGVIFALTSFLLFLSYRNLDVGLAAAILFLYPVYVVIIEKVFFKVRFTRPVLIALLLALAGVAGLSVNTPENVTVSGLLLAVLSGICYAWYPVAISRGPAVPVLKQTFVINAVCALVSLAVLLLSGGGLGVFTAGAYLNIAGVSLISALLAMYGAVVCMQKCGATIASISGALEPLTAVFLGIVCFREDAGILKISGIILILAAVIILALYQKAGSPHPDGVRTS